MACWKGCRLVVVEFIQPLNKEKVWEGCGVQLIYLAKSYWLLWFSDFYIILIIWGQLFYSKKNFTKNHHLFCL